MSAGFEPFGKAVFEERCQRAIGWLNDHGYDALYLHPGNNLSYFTGLKWHPSERMVAGVLTRSGELFYVSPAFEIDTLKDYWELPGKIVAWEEHEDPGISLRDGLRERQLNSGKIAVDPVTPLFMFDLIRSGLADGWQADSATALIDQTRGRKSVEEIALIRRSHQMTAAVIDAAQKILEPGISTTEVTAFINQAHRAVGADGSFFCIVLFGVATSFPHGVKEPQILGERDWVLIDTGCRLQGYHSDITRSFAVGEPTDEQRAAWEVEKRAQIAGMSAARPGVACAAVDDAARASLQQDGYGPGYQLPGLPHRTGHGCGLDIHEAPYLVAGNQQPMEPGMVFSCEPMLVVPDKFGIRLEDHFYVTDEGAEWFTRPAPSIDQLFEKDTY
jgi:Xaa-Pro dipeptidase